MAGLLFRPFLTVITITSERQRLPQAGCACMWLFSRSRARAFQLCVLDSICSGGGEKKTPPTFLSGSLREYSLKLSRFFLLFLPHSQIMKLKRQPMIDWAQLFSLSYPRGNPSEPEDVWRRISHQMVGHWALFNAHHWLKFRTKILSTGFPSLLGSCIFS
jgi:hypothetical protein